MLFTANGGIVMAMIGHIVNSNAQNSNVSFGFVQHRFTFFFWPITFLRGRSLNHRSPSLPACKTQIQLNVTY